MFFQKLLKTTGLISKGNLQNVQNILLIIKRKLEYFRKSLGRQLPKKWFPWTFLDNDGTLTDGEVVNLDWLNVTFLNKNGEKVTNDMSKGEGKLPWRLDWPAKWKILNVTFEAFGKDHATKGGSYDTGKQLSEIILQSKTPLDLVYEWIHLKGKGVMHSSTGLAISAEDMLTMAPPEVIRWIVMKPQPNRHIDFDPGLGLLNMVDRYDQAEQDYHDGKMEENEKRAFELSQIGKIAIETKSFTLQTSCYIISI